MHIHIDLNTTSTIQIIGIRGEDQEGEELVNVKESHEPPPLLYHLHIFEREKQPDMRISPCYSTRVP